VHIGGDIILCVVSLALVMECPSERSSLCVWAVSKRDGWLFVFLFFGCWFLADVFCIFLYGFDV